MNTKRTAGIVAGLAATAVLLVGCGSSGGSESTKDEVKDKVTTTTEKLAELQLTDAWARQSAAGQDMGAAYLTIESPTADKLVGVSVPSSVAKEAQLHETVMADGTTTTGDMGSSDMTTTTAMGSDMTSTTMGGSMDGNMTMQEVESIDIPANTKVQLKPGGYHIMLMELAAPLEKGQQIELTLTFEKAGEQTVVATVREM
ncbi:MAG: copper chaperone PCu(A)C [Acidimicrobiales bacterium]